MKCRLLLKIFTIILVYITHETVASKCVMKNTSCSDIRVAGGFRFDHKCPEKSEIYVEGTNKTQLALVVPSQQLFNHTSAIVKIDNHSVTAKNCQDLTITCAFSTGSSFLKETCEKFKTISENTSLIQPNISTTPLTPLSPVNESTTWIACVVIFAVVTLIFGYLLTSYGCWKKEQGFHRNTGYFRYALNFSCVKRWVPRCFCRKQNGSEFQVVQLRDLEGQRNDDIRNGTDPHGSGETDQPTLEIVTSGVTAAPKTITLSDHRPVNGFRNMRDDPGGINGTNKGREINRTEQLESGGTAAHHQAEEKPLLADQRAANGDLEMEREAVALVNKLSSNQDRVRSCSDALVTDVESRNPGKPANKI